MILVKSSRRSDPGSDPGSDPDPDPDSDPNPAKIQHGIGRTRTKNICLLIQSQGFVACGQTRVFPEAYRAMLHYCRV